MAHRNPIPQLFQLTTAISLHLRVAEIVAATFPDEVEPGKVKQLDGEFDSLVAKVLKAADAEASS